MTFSFGGIRLKNILQIYSSFVSTFSASPLLFGATWSPICKYQQKVRAEEKNDKNSLKNFLESVK